MNRLWLRRTAAAWVVLAAKKMGWVMRYLKSLFFNFLVVFFANYLLPGIDPSITKLPHIGGDFAFAIGLGLLNSLIYPALKLVHRPTAVSRLIMLATPLNFIVYAAAKFLPMGVHIASVEGYLLGAIVVSIGSVLLNHFEMKGHSSSEYPINPGI